MVCYVRVTVCFQVRLVDFLSHFFAIKWPVHCHHFLSTSICVCGYETNAARPCLISLSFLLSTLGRDYYCLWFDISVFIYLCIFSLHGLNALRLWQCHRFLNTSTFKILSCFKVVFDHIRVYDLPRQRRGLDWRYRIWIWTLLHHIMPRNIFNIFGDGYSHYYSTWNCIIKFPCIMNNPVKLDKYQFLKYMWNKWQVTVLVPRYCN